MLHFNHCHDIQRIDGPYIVSTVLQVGKVTCEDEWVEPETHPLWEYPAYPCSEVHTLINFDLTSPVPSTTIRSCGMMELTGEKQAMDSKGGEEGGVRQCNAVVLWMDYQLSEQHRSTTGLVKVWVNGVLGVCGMKMLMCGCTWQ